MPESKHYAARIRWRRQGLILVAVDVEESVIDAVDPVGGQSRACAVCDQMFCVPSTPGRNLRYCSDECRKVGRVRTQRAYEARTRRERGGKCADCGKPVSDPRCDRCPPCARAMVPHRKAS